MSEAVKPTPVRFAWLRSIEPNAVLVKDLRQAARNWSVTGAVLLMMAIFFIVSLGFLLTDEMAGRGNYLGAQLFASVAGVMMTVTFIFLPIYVGIRSMTERASASADLLYITTMSPARIIAGKFLSGAALVGIFFTAALPFMVFSYLLRELLQTAHVENPRAAGAELHFEVEGGEDEAFGVLNTLIANGHRVVEFRQTKANLEDIFMNVTEGSVQ